MQRVGRQQSLKNAMNVEMHGFDGKTNLDSTNSLLDSQLSILQLNRADSLDK